MAIEESAHRELAKTSRKVIESTTDILEQVATIGIAREDYRIGGQNEAWFTDPTYQVVTPSQSSMPVPPSEPPLPINIGSDGRISAAYTAINDYGDSFRPLPLANRPPTSSSVQYMSSGDSPITKISINQMGSDGTLNAITKATIGENGAISTQRLEAGAHTSNRFDANTAGEAIADTTRISYQSTDTAQGSYQFRKISTLMGAGAPTQWAKSMDTRAKIYDRDSGNVIAIQDVLTRSSSTNGKVYISSATGQGYRADLNENMRLVSAALNERGINVESLTERDIDKMIGGRGKHSYGNRRSHIHSGDSVIFNGGFRDNISGTTDTIFRRNTGWAGKQGKGGVYIDEDTNTLLREARYLKGVMKKESPFNSPGGNKDHISESKMQGGAIGLGKAWIYEAMDGSDMGEGYQTARALKLGANATALVGIGLNSGAQSLVAQGLAGAGRAGAFVGRGLTNIGGEIYSLGSNARRARWQTHRATINAKFETFGESAKNFGRTRQKAINQKTKERVKFVQTSVWKHTKNSAKTVGRAIGQGARWSFAQIGNTRLGRPVVNALSAPIGYISRPIRDAFTVTKAKIEWFKRAREELLNKLAENTAFKIIRAPFSAFNWVKQKIHEFIIKAAIAAGGIILVNVIALMILGAVTAMFSFIFTSEGGTSTIGTMEAAETNYTENLIDYYTNKAQTVIAETDCTGCTAISGKTDCISCRATGVISCITCNGTGNVLQSCLKCTGTGYILKKSGTPNVYEDNFSIMEYNGCTACGGSGQDILYYNQDGQAWFTSKNFKKGSGTFETLCSTCLGTLQSDCKDCAGDGSLGTTCTSCNGKGVIDIMGACTHKTADGILIPHTVLFEHKGANNTSYSNLVLPNIPSTSFTFLDGSQATYDMAYVYKGIMSMGMVVALGTEDEKVFTAYCENLMNKYLHSAKIEHAMDGGNDAVIHVYTTNAGLTDLMKLESKSVRCTAPDCCGQTFPAITGNWLKAFDDNINWKGWSSGSNFQTALEWYNMPFEEWEDFGVKMPFAKGERLSSDVINTILINAQASLTASDSSKRLESIEKALTEMNRLHVYSNVGDREVKKDEKLDLLVDCSSYVLGVLQSTGVRLADSGGSTEDIKNFTNASSLRPGDLLLKYKPGHNISNNTGDSNHVMMFIGYNEHGKPMLIECTLDSSEYTHRHGDIFIRTYDSIAAMKSERGITYIKNPYGD